MQRSARKPRIQNNVKTASDQTNSEQRLRKRHSRHRTSHFSWTFAIPWVIVGLVIGLLKISPVKDLAHYAASRMFLAKEAARTEPQAFLRIHETLGCTSEQEDFDILSRDMEDAGT
jgi:hypothetical protein